MDKGNIVKSNEHGTEGLLLAITRDGKRAKVKVFGRDDEVWRPLDSMTVLVDGDETCWKCQGSGIFQGGGGTVNGKFTGYTGECYACSGKGTQNNADRTRNHYYWHRQEVVDMAVAQAERGEFESLERTAQRMSKPIPNVVADAEPPARKPKAGPKTAEEAKAQRKARRQAKQRVVVDEGSTLIECKGCGTVHREDTMCPW